MICSWIYPKASILKIVMVGLTSYNSSRTYTGRIRMDAFGTTTSKTRYDILGSNNQPSTNEFVA